MIAPNFSDLAIRSLVDLSHFFSRVNQKKSVQLRSYNAIAFSAPIASGYSISLLHVHQVLKNSGHTPLPHSIPQPTEMAL
jgi:hypothetical protein